MSTTNRKWLPPQQEGFGPWIEIPDSERPSGLEDGACIQWLHAEERLEQSFDFLEDGFTQWAIWGNDWSGLVAYCVKLEEQPLPEAEQPTLTGGKLTGDHYYRVAVSEPMAPDLQPYAAECADIIEALDMTFNEGEAFKALWRLAAARQGRGKPGNKPQYDADKAAHYGQRVAACVRRQECGAA